MEEGSEATRKYWFEAKLEQVKKEKHPRLDLGGVISCGIVNDKHSTTNTQNDKKGEEERENEDKEEGETLQTETEKLFLALLRLEFSELAAYLVHLNLSENRLTSFFAELCDLVLLETLDLHNNVIESIPPEIEQLSKLQHLDMRNNRLTSLPVELGITN